MPAKYPGILIRLAEARFHYIAFQKVPYPYAIAKDGCGKNVQHKLLQTIEKKFFKNLVGEVGLAQHFAEIANSRSLLRRKAVLEIYGLEGE